MQSLNKKIFPFKSIEEKWLSKGLGEKRKGPSKYILEMLPYPSGNLHMGHVRNYTIVDILARFYHLKGFNVTRPFGWDSFGLPAENAAIERGIHPRDWTLDNIKSMKKTIELLNYAIDWQNEISTCDFDYYKHQQMLFIEMYKKGYVIRKPEFVNWDPVMKTVLANEQVVDGKAWRSGAIVERKKITQWFFNISKYSEILLQGLDKLDNWPEKVKKMQQQWIGKYEGYILNFKAKIHDKAMTLEVFTTMPHTVHGATFIAVSKEFECGIKDLKDGQIIGTSFNDYSKMEIPVIVTNYVLSDYGTGIVMGVPSMDERDFNVAKQNGLKMLPIMNEEGFLINSDSLNGLTPEQALEKFESHKKTRYRLRDWCISRQRYWGTPIPMIHCEKCGIVPSQEPVELPYDVAFDGRGNPLQFNEEWVNTFCPSCKETAKRDTDTMDTFVDSSWYFLRYLCNKSETPIDPKIVNPHLPVNIYVGGVEHAILHLLYSRFFMIMLKDLGYVNNEVPFDKMVTQGMVCYNSYKGLQSGKYYYPSEVEEREDGKFYAEGEEVLKGTAEKMSKSLKNTIDPISIIHNYGSDSLRFFIISDSPTEKDFFWNTNALFGCYKFMNKIWSTNYAIEEWENEDCEKDQKIYNNVVRELNCAINSLEVYEMNIYIARIRMAFNLIEENLPNLSKKTLLEIWKQFLLVIWPVTPSISSECYERIFKAQIYEQTLAPILISEKNREYTFILQINGSFKKSYKTFNLDKKYNIEFAKEALKITQYKEYLYLEQDNKHIINFIK